MDEEYEGWIRRNRNVLIESNIPASEILDSLVSDQVFDPRHDDYQKITTRDTLNDQIRALLDGLLSKSNEAFACFKKALQARCPHVLAKCDDMPHEFTQFDADLRSYYESIEELRPLSWIKDKSACVKMSDTCRLAMIDKEDAKVMASDQMASSVYEQKRREDLSTKARKERTVHLENIFEEHRDDQNTGSSNVASSSRAPSNVSAVVSADGKEGERSSSWYRLQNMRKQVGIYGSAGCGKTATLMRAASLYAREQLWRSRFRLFLYWRLRERKVQQADTLEQLLLALPNKPSRQRCKPLAKSLLANEGEGVLVVLDGVDELEARRNAFVREMLDGSALPKACVLATSRPCSEAREYFESYDENLELLGFTEEQVETFIQRRLVSKPEALSKLREVLVRNVSLAALMIVPLLAFMVCDVFSVSSDNPPSTRTQLYSKLVAHVIRREVQEGRVYFSRPEIDCIRAVVDVRKFVGKAKTLLLEVSQLAFVAYKNGRAIFDQSVLEEAGCSPESDALALGLLDNHNEEEDDERTVVQQYSFKHLTVQEFLVAFLLADQVTSATPENREQTLREKMNDLGMGPHQLVVVQFLAGLLPAHLHHVFFTILNDWLHHNWDEYSEECQDRLRACLHCAREACGEDAFPANLQLPKKVKLRHVTASDLEVLSSAMNKCPSSVEKLVLEFDKVEGEVEERRFSRVQTQTKLAVEKLMSVLSTHTSLRRLFVYGPKYKLFTERSWRCFVETVHNNPLSQLEVSLCCLEDDVIELCIELEHNTQLSRLYLAYNMISDRGVRRLADVLTHNHTVRTLRLQGNRHSAETAEYVTRQLTHITPDTDLTV